MNKQETRAAKAQEQYEAALAQARAVPSGYTKRELKRADRARKLAALPLWKRVVPSVVLVGLFVFVVVSCGANAAANQREVEQCLTVAEEAGWDSTVPAIRNACSDPDARQRILDGEWVER